MPDGEPRDVRLVDVDADLEGAHVGDGHDGAGAGRAARHDRADDLADLGILAQDDAGERGGDAGLVQLEPGRLDVGLGDLDAGLGGQAVGPRGLRGRLGRLRSPRR